MQETLKIAIGIAFLLLGIPIGSYLAEKTKEELKQGKKWFKLIIFVNFLNLIFFGFENFLIDGTPFGNVSEGINPFALAWVISAMISFLSESFVFLEPLPLLQ